jgi:hypothetical protein
MALSSCSEQLVSAPRFSKVQLRKLGLTLGCFHPTAMSSSTPSRRVSGLLVSFSVSCNGGFAELHANALACGEQTWWCILIATALLLGVGVDGLTQQSCECKSKCSITVARPWCYTYNSCGYSPGIFESGTWDFCSMVNCLLSFPLLSPFHSWSTAMREWLPRELGLQGSFCHH